MKKMNISMNILTRVVTGLSVLAGASLLVSCSSMPTSQEFLASFKNSFSERGPAKLDRLDQTEIQRVCSEANASGKELDPATAARIEKTALAAVKFPADGKFIGDWREGEKIAQNGRGLTFTDAINGPVGANCYACHQLSPTEISFGNQGPSLLKYGSLRQVKDPSSKESEEMVKYTWIRIFNTHALRACSNMPRFGDAGILNEKQMKDVMALLLDPQSPVNK